MSESSQTYRKKLTTRGVIYVAGQEVEIIVRNLSITGLLAEWNAMLYSPELFETLKMMTKVDLWLPDMRVIGEAEVVRVDVTEGCGHLGLKLLHITHDVPNGLYKRKNYRKAIVAPGTIMFNGQWYDFISGNVSVTGLLAHFEEKIDVSIGTITVFDFNHLNLHGKIKVVWFKPTKEGGTMMGLEYVEMAKKDIKGIPIFEH